MKQNEFRYIQMMGWCSNICIQLVMLCKNSFYMVIMLYICAVEEQYALKEFLKHFNIVMEFGKKKKKFKKGPFVM